MKPPWRKTSYGVIIDKEKHSPKLTYNHRRCHRRLISLDGNVDDKTQLVMTACLPIFGNTRLLYGTALFFIIAVALCTVLEKMLRKVCCCSRSLIAMTRLVCLPS